MKLNHLNLTVPDVAATRAFFENHFQFRCTDEKGDNMLVVLYGKDDFILTVMSESFNRNSNHIYPDAFHLGFILDTQDEVDALYKQLLDAAVRLDKPPGKIRNSYGFYFHFQNLMIEIGHYF